MKKLRQIVEVVRSNGRAHKLANDLYKRQLKKTPDNEHDGWVNVMPVNHLYTKKFSLTGYHFSEPAEEDVPLQNIRSSQAGVYLRRTHEFIDSPPKTKQLPFVTIYPDGTHELEDGNHRVSVAKLKGDKTIRATVRRAVKNE